MEAAIVTDTIGGRATLRAGGHFLSFLGSRRCLGTAESPTEARTHLAQRTEAESEGASTESGQLWQVCQTRGADWPR